MGNEDERLCDHERADRERERGRGGGVKCETRVVGREVLGEEGTCKGQFALLADLFFSTCNRVIHFFCASNESIKISNALGTAKKLASATSTDSASHSHILHDLD